MSPKEPKVAPFLRRITAHLIDLSLIISVLTVVGLYLPVAPPPVDAMAFYSEQDFKNYFTLVGIWVAIFTVVYLLAMTGIVASTPGMKIIGLRYLGLDGSAPTRTSILKRFLGSIIYSLLILLPGPIIAFIVVLFTHAIFKTPITTVANMLELIGVPDLAQLAIHSLSFFALGIGLAYVYKQLSHRSEKPEMISPSWYDRKCGCTIVDW